MAGFRFVCYRCGRTAAADPRTLRCPGCAGPLVVAYDGQAGPGESRVHGNAEPAMPLPLSRPASRVTLGEGDTPVVSLPAVQRALGLGAVWAKLESSNPTGSFKDRGSAVLISAAVEHGVRVVVEDSSGNAGASVAAYAARAGVKAHVFVPASAPAAKLAQIEVYGACTHLIDGSREDVAAAAVAFHAENGIVYASHNLSPYFIEGTKAFAYEALNQFANDPPDHVVVPVGNGSLLLGAFRGFQEMTDRGILSAAPKLHCVQAEAVMPIVSAFEGRRWDAARAAGTVAGGIAVGAPPRLEQVLYAVRTTGGTATAVSEADILRWQKKLAAEEGVYAEPTSAAAFAGLEKLARAGTISSAHSVLVPVTGHGLKAAPPPR